jgi:hypothetical protein
MRLNDYLAQKYGSNYREALRQTAQESGLASTEKPVEQDTNFWSNLGAGGFELLNSLTMGIPEFLVKNIGGEGGSKALEDLRKYHKTATDIGGGIGTVGSMFIPGGAVVKGLGLGAKALGAAGAAEKLGKAANYLKGGELTGNLAQKIGQGALRGAGQGLEQGAVRGLTNLDFTSPEALQESAGQSIEGLGAGVGIGALAGGALGPLAQRLLGKTKLKDVSTGKTAEYGEGGARFGINELREKVDDATLSDAGIPTRALRKAVGKIGYNNRVEGGRLIEDYKSDLAKTIRDTGIRGKKGWEALFDKNKEQWQAIDDGFKSANPDPTAWKPALRNSLMQDPDIQAFISDAPSSKVAQDVFDDAIGVITERPSVSAIRTKLSNMIRANVASQDVDKQLAARTAMQIKNKIDDFVANNSTLTPAEIADAKHTYKVLQPFLIAEARDASKLDSFFDAGPGTAEKLIANSLFAGGGGALGLGSSLMGQSQGGGDIDIGQALQSGIMGALAGGVAKKTLPALGNKLLAGAGRQAGRALESEKVRDLLEKAVQGAGSLTKAPAGLAIGGALADKDQDLSKIPEINGPAEPQQGTEVSTKSAPYLNPRLKYILGNRLNYLYETEYANQLTPQEFLSRVQAKTKNFSDQESLAGILFDNDKDRENYIRQVQAFRDLKDVDLEKVLKGPGGIELPVLGRIGGDEATADETEKLINTILTLRNEGDILKRTDAQEKQLRKALAMVKKNPEMLQQFIESTGINFGQLRDLGVI